MDHTGLDVRCIELWSVLSDDPGQGTLRQSGALSIAPELLFKSPPCLSRLLPLFPELKHLSLNRYMCHGSQVSSHWPFQLFWVSSPSEGLR